MDKDCSSFVVDFENKTCQYREFQLNQFICAHEVAACGMHNLSIYNYISRYYKKEEWVATYANMMHPIGTPSGWTVPKHIKNRFVRSLIMPQSAGRPKMSRIPSTDKQSIRQKCLCCDKLWHNRKTCRNPILLCNTITQSRIRFTSTITVKGFFFFLSFLIFTF